MPQKWHIGKIEAELITQKPILKVGDTLIFKFRLARNLRDTILIISDFSSKNKEKMKAVEQSLGWIENHACKKMFVNDGVFQWRDEFFNTLRLFAHKK